MENSKICDSNHLEKEPFTPEQLLKVAQSYVKDNFHLPHEVMEYLHADFVAAAFEAGLKSAHKEGIRSYQHQAGRWAAGLTARAWLRQKKYEAKISADKLDCIVDEKAGPLNIMLEKERDGRILKAMEKLPERTRWIVELSVLDSWSFERIGREMQITSARANFLCRNALKALRQELEYLADSI